MITIRYKFILITLFSKKSEKYHDHFSKNQITNFDRVTFNPVRLCIMIMI